MCPSDNFRSIYLFTRVTHGEGDREIEKDKERGFTCWFSPQIAEVAGLGPAGSQESGTPSMSPIGIKRALLWPSSPALLGTLA